MNSELFYTKEKNGWTVTDKLGNKASGITREQAEQQYNLIYHINKVQTGIDMRDYIKFPEYVNFK